MSTAVDTTQHPEKLGAFLGVFTPSILTILGVIMYLRFGWVVGQAGLMRTLLIVLIANGITMITSLSVSALATNMQVGVGGNYFLLSRSLGIEIGGALGLPLFLSQALSVTLYSFGLAESIMIAFPSLGTLIPGVKTQVLIQIFSLIMVLSVSFLSAKSARLALKAQVPLMAAVGLSIFLLFYGADFELKSNPIWNVHESYPGFWVIFAVFFPAVTGVTTGVSMSGDLKNPNKAIPIGIISAVTVGFFIYLAIPVLLAFNASPDELVSDSMIWTRIAAAPYLIFPGLWGAILSSAIGSMLAAPRTLQALAHDRIAPKSLSKLSRNGEPVNALIVTAALAVGAIALGNLNTVAIVVTMFFLTTYAMANLGAAMETIIGDPSYRPKIKIHWIISMLGALGCIWAMFLISPWACLAAIVIEIALWVFLKRRALRATWGDIWRGYYQAMIRYALFKLKDIPQNPRNWRPNILLFAGDIHKRLDLINFAAWFGQNRGLVTICDILIEDERSNLLEDISHHQHEMDAIVSDSGLLAFSQVNVARNLEQGIIDIAQANGIAGFSSNTVMMGMNNDVEGLAKQLMIMAQLSRFKKSFILVKFKDRQVYKRGNKITIWWGGLERNSDLLLLLAYLLSLNPPWTNADIRVKSLANDEKMLKNTRVHLENLLLETRINAHAEVVLLREGESVVDIIHSESEDSEIVFMGLAIPEPGKELSYARRVQTLCKGLPTVFFVRNAGTDLGSLL